MMKCVDYLPACDSVCCACIGLQTLGMEKRQVRAGFGFGFNSALSFMFSDSYMLEVLSNGCSGHEIFFENIYISNSDQL